MRLAIAALLGAIFSACALAGPPSPLAPEPSIVPMPSALDHSGIGPMIDRALIPRAATGFADHRVRSVWRNRGSGADCRQGDDNCAIAQGFETVPSNLGAFRVACSFAKMAYDDPIVFPGQPGVSHLHTFTGNVGVDAFSTVESIAGSGNSTCGGGTLNRSSYWFPTMIDTANGKPLMPTTNVVYYKGSYEFDISKTVRALPAGLRMVSGNAKNTDPNKVGARYVCIGPKHENPGWKTTITAAYADGTCKVGGDFIMEVGFPFCWDGVNLDSPNHAAHIVGAEQDRTAPFAKHCPTTHPVTLPVISYNIHYLITDNEAVGRWRLSSDMDPSLPAGISGHGDYFLGWDKETMQTWIDGCLRAKKDCHADLLGNKTMLF